MPTWILDYPDARYLLLRRSAFECHLEYAHEEASLAFRLPRCSRMPWPDDFVVGEHAGDLAVSRQRCLSIRELPWAPDPELVGSGRLSTRSWDCAAGIPDPACAFRTSRHATFKHPCVTLQEPVRNLDWIRLHRLPAQWNWWPQGDGLSRVFHRCLPLSGHSGPELPSYSGDSIRGSGPCRQSLPIRRHQMMRAEGNAAVAIAILLAPTGCWAARMPPGFRISPAGLCSPGQSKSIFPFSRLYFPL